jgi:methylated-DNA-[protein]-cysteine S-methyltransferase
MIRFIAMSPDQVQVPSAGHTPDRATDRATTPCYAVMDSPLGELLLVGDSLALHRVDLTAETRIDPSWRADPAPLADAVSQLAAYFEGGLTDFDLAVAVGGTPFQRRVWRRLTQIPYGSTATYGQLARELGLPRGARAVGAANAVNPVPLVLPCHRVLASSGDLAGYGLGGPERKRQLLELEGGQLALAC